MVFLERFLQQSMKNCKVIIPKYYFYNSDIFENDIMLLKNNNGYLNFENKIEQLDILLKKNNKNEMKLFEYNDDKYFFTTNNNIPYRWLLILKDFFWNDCKIEVINNYDITPNEKNAKIIINNFFKNKKEYSFKVLDETWQTGNGKFSLFSNRILKNCNKYSSLQTNNNNCYTELYGKCGITINNIFIHQYIDFVLNNEYYSIRDKNKLYFSKDNYVTSINEYKTNKYINYEELYCLYLSLNKQNIITTKIKQIE